MPRPYLCRRIRFLPEVTLYKPAGVPGRLLEQIVLSVDELEALRLTDLEGQLQEQAAQQMGVSRQTFGSILARARRKLAEALIRGKALRIEGGHVELAEGRRYLCSDCRHTWALAFGGTQPAPAICPNCHNRNLKRTYEEVQ
jgi:predicted DNA-binding protein (UPF0251 family)